MPEHLPKILVDDREVSRQDPNDEDKYTGVDLADAFRSHRYLPEVQSVRLTAGDIAFSGEGKGGLPVMVGVERKRIRDMLGSIRTGRFSGEQLPKLNTHYEHVFLLLEGDFRTDWATGLLSEYRWDPEERRKAWVPITLGKEVFLGLFLDSFIATITTHTPVQLIRTRDVKESVESVLSLAHSFSKPWDDHTAHISIHRPDQYGNEGKASTVRRVAFNLSGVGWERSGEIDRHFPSVESMVHKTTACDRCENRVCAPVLPSEFQKLDGFGKVLSKRVYSQLRGQHEEEGKSNG